MIAMAYMSNVHKQKHILLERVIRDENKWIKLIQLFEMYGVRRVKSYEGRKFMALFLINHILESAANHLRKV